MDSYIMPLLPNYCRTPFKWDSKKCKWNARLGKKCQKKKKKTLLNGNINIVIVQFLIEKCVVCHVKTYIFLLWWTPSEDVNA